MNHLMDHLKDGVGKLHHRIWNVLDYFLDYSEERIVQDVVILLQ